VSVLAVRAEASDVEMGLGEREVDADGDQVW
jgi:hypothetical protein